MNFLKKIFSQKQKSESASESSKEIDNTLDATKISINQIEDFENSLNTFPLLRSGSGPMKSITLSDGSIHEVPKSARPVTLGIGDANVSILLGQDLGGSYQWIKNSQIESQDLSKIILNAYQNVFKLHPDMGFGNIKFATHPNINQVFCVTNGGGFAGSLIILENIWGEIFNSINSEEVNFIIPSPDTLLYCNSKNKAASDFLKEHAKKSYSESQRPISQNMFFKSKGNEIQELDKDKSPGHNNK